jgi:hypothetical protein
MSDFDRRFKLLARAAARAIEPPLPPPPDGARLRRLAEAAGACRPRPWGEPLPSAVALALLWAVALPAAGPAWRAARGVAVRLASSATAPACCTARPAAQLPSPPSAPELALPRLPPLPNLPVRLPWVDPSSEALPKETAS